MSSTTPSPLHWVLKVRIRTLAILCGMAGFISAALGVEAAVEHSPGSPPWLLISLGIALLICGSLMWSENRWALGLLAVGTLSIGVVRLVLLLIKGPPWDPVVVLAGVGLPLLCSVYATRILVLARRGEDPSAALSLQGK